MTVVITGAVVTGVVVGTDVAPELVVIVVKVGVEVNTCAMVVASAGLDIIVVITLVV